MKLLSLYATDIFSYKQLEIDFTSFGNVLIIGKTGSGKSSIFDIVSWCLYGKTSRGTKIIRDVPKTAKRRIAVAVLEFEIDNIHYRVSRKYSAASLVSVYKDGKEIDFRTKAKQAQQYIIGLIGYDYRSYVNAAYFTQGDVGEFLNSRSTDRIKILEKIFDLDFFQYAKKNVSADLEKSKLETASIIGESDVHRRFIDSIDIDVQKNRRKKIKNKISKLNRIISNLEKKQLEIKSVERLLDQKSNLVDNFKSISRQYDNRIADIQNSNKQLLKVFKDADSIKEKFKNSKDAVLLARAIKNKISNLEVKLEKHTGILAKYKSELDILGSKKDDVVKLLSMSTCPKCNRPVKKSDIVDWNYEMGSIDNRIQEILHAVNEEQAICSGIDSKIDLYQDRYNELQLASKMNKEYAAMLNSARIARQSISDNKIKITELRNEAADVLQSKSADIEKLNEKISNSVSIELKGKIDRALSAARDAAIDSANVYHTIDKEISDWYKARKELVRLESEITTIENKSDIARYWYDNLDDIKLRMLTAIIPYIEEIANKYLQIVLNGKSITMSADASRKMNKLDIIITDTVAGITRPLENWSGGERDMMSLSIYFAFFVMISQFSRKKIGYMMLDEKFTSIDSALRDVVLSMIQREFEGRSIYVISHLDNMERYFDTVIQVTKINGISSLVVK